MHCSTSSSLSRAAVMFMATLTLFTSVSMGYHAAGSKAIFPRTQCLASHNYTVVANDTCRTISQAQSVSTADIIALNCLNPQGTNLVANSTIQIPGCCTTYTVKPGDNCTSIVSSAGNVTSTASNLTLANFYAFNPLINNSNCSNLLAGDNVCLTAPLGTPFSPTDCSASNTTSTTTSADTPPPSLAPGTNTSCPADYTYVAKTGDDCTKIAQDHTITVQRFQDLNPEVNLQGRDCANILAGQEYCVSPA